MIRIRPGRCCVCGCSDRWGCAAGCAWVDAYGVLCSRCAHNMAVLVLTWRKKGITN